MIVQPIISVNLWQILISLVNLLIIYKIMKKFLFKPVQKVMNAREEKVNRIFSEADESRSSADQMKREYEQKLAGARAEADTLLQTAARTAQLRGDQIVSEAKDQAAHAKQKAEDEIARQKQQMLADVRSEISGLAVDIASKVVEREINEEDYEGFVNDFIQNVGDPQ